MGEEYVSIEKAFVILKRSGQANDYIDIDDLKVDIEKESLKVYRKLCWGYSTYRISQYPFLPEEMLDVMQITGGLRWVDNSLLYNFNVIFDANGTEVYRHDVHGANGIVDKKDVLLKRNDLTAFTHDFYNTLNIYSQEETAKFLGVSTNKVFDLLTRNKLTAVIELSRPVIVSSRMGHMDYVQVEISGRVAVDVSRLEFDNDDRATLISTLYQGDKEYLFFEKRTVSKTEIYISAESLEGFMIEEGYDRIPKTNQISTQLVNKGMCQLIDIKAYVAENRGKMSEDEIIFNLRNAGFTNNEVGTALGGTYRERSHALAQRISRKYNKYKKMLGT